MCDSRPYKIFLKKFCKKIYHTHITIILHKKNMCNTFFNKTVDNFFNFKKIKKIFKFIFNKKNIEENIFFINVLF